MWRWLEIANLSLSEMPIRFGTVDWVRLDQGKFLKLARLLRRGRFKPCRQCDQIVQFMKSIDNNFRSKVAQIICHFWCSLENITFKIKTVVDTIWATCGKNWATFYS